MQLCWGRLGFAASANSGLHNPGVYIYIYASISGVYASISQVFGQGLLRYSHYFFY